MKIKRIFSLQSIFYCSILIVIFSSTSNSQVILSEIMFDPVGSEYYNEFIEIYNTSQTNTIDLAGWQISDSADVDFIIAYNQGTLLKPLQYAIILDAGYFENSSQYENLIPPDALVLTIDDAAFGSQGLSNSHAEPIMLISSNGDTVAKYRYSLDNQPGYSDEKRNLLGDDSLGNWTNSKVLNGSPGFENSVLQSDYDIKIELTGFPANALPDQQITLLASITNIGIKDASHLELVFFEDSNLDSQFTDDEQISNPISIFDTLHQNDKIQVRKIIDPLASGVHLFAAYASFSLDQETSNNIMSTIIKVGFNSNVVLINEIMYRPSAGQAEWIELYNPTEDSINLQYWQFSDAIVDKRIRLSDTALFIPKQDYLIIAEDSTIFQTFQADPRHAIIPAQGFPALNNDGDQIVLYDLIGNIIDQVNYQASWGSEPGISLERIMADQQSNDPMNWALSKNSNGGTPGFKNSNAPADFDLAITAINFAPHNPFPGEEVTISVSITNSGCSAISDFQLSCFIDLNQDSIFQENEQIGEIFTTSELLNCNDSIIVSIPFTPNRSGIFLIGASVVSEQDANSSNNTYISNLSVGFERNSLVVNEIMYSPPSGQPEWIELFNPQDISVDIKNWSFSDSDSSESQFITQNRIEVAPQSFVILSADSSILYFYDLNNCPLMIIKNWQRLNDDRDKVFVFDANKNVMDEICYSSNWGGTDEVSLERINPNLTSNDSSNWSSCVFMEQGGTPGQRNSIFVDVLPCEAELSISPNPFSPDGDGRDDFTIISYQLPFNLSRIHVKIFDILGRQVRFLVNNQPSGTNNSLTWDGRDDKGFICRMGIYIVYLEAIHYQRGVVKSLKKSVVLAKQL